MEDLPVMRQIAVKVHHRATGQLAEQVLHQEGINLMANKVLLTVSIGLSFVLEVDLIIYKKYLI